MNTMRKIPGNKLIHASKGRLRFRFAFLKGNEPLAGRLAATLSAAPGIREAVTSTRTGSLLLVYDEVALAQPENGIALLQALAGLLPVAVTDDSVSFRARGGEDVALLAAGLRACLDRGLGVERILADASGQVTISYDSGRLNVVRVIQALLGMAESWKRLGPQVRNDPSARVHQKGEQNTEEISNG